MNGEGDTVQPIAEGAGAGWIPAFVGDPERGRDLPQAEERQHLLLPQSRAPEKRPWTLKPQDR